MKPLSSIIALGFTLLASAAFAGSPPAGPAPHGAGFGRPHGQHHHGPHPGWRHRPFQFVGPVVIPPVEQLAPPAPAPAPVAAPVQPRPQVVVVVHERPRCFEPRIIVLKPTRASTREPRVHYGRPKQC